MEWKGSSFEGFREIGGSIAGVIIRLFIFLFISFNEAIKIAPNDLYFTNKAQLMEKLNRV